MVPYRPVSLRGNWCKRSARGRPIQVDTIYTQGILSISSNSPVATSNTIKYLIFEVSVTVEYLTGM